MLKQSFIDDEDYKLWWLFNQVRHIMFRARDRELRKYDVSNTQAAILAVIQIIGKKATPAEISRLMFRETNTISANLDVMVKKGLVERKKDLNKKNWVRVCITEKGKEVYEQTVKRESIHYIMSDLSEEQRQKLREILELLRDKGLDWLSKEKKLFTLLEM